MTNEEIENKLQQIEDRVKKLEFHHKEPGKVETAFFLIFSFSMITFLIILLVMIAKEKWKEFRKNKNDKK